MRLVNFYRKPISVLVMVTFTILLCFWANQAPAAPSAPASEKNPGTTMEQGDSNGPNFIEEEAESGAVLKKPKKFPWLLVAAAVVVGGAALYFLVLKQTKYELTVNLGAGTAGTPATGKYKKGEVVAYSYSAQSGYADLHVMLDGAEVAVAGSVTMDKAHTITTSAIQGATMQVNSTPAGAKIYLNNVDSGFTTPHSFFFTTAATANVLLRLCGYQDYSHAQSIVVGQAYTIDANLLPGILDDFVVSSACWKPYTASEWTVSGGIYKFNSAKKIFNYSLYDHSFNQTKWSAEVKMKRVIGDIHGDNAIVLIEKMVGTKVWGYWFSCVIFKNSWYIVRLGGYDIYNGGGDYHWLGGRPNAACINAGLNQWNTLKVVRNGSQYSYYINNAKVRTVTDSLWNPHFLALGVVLYNKTTEMQYDYVKLNFSSGAIDMSAKAAEPYDYTMPIKNWPELIK